MKIFEGFVNLISVLLAIVAFIVAIDIISNRYQSNNQTTIPMVTPEILDIDTYSICYGTFDFASGTKVDDCTESYKIASDSMFIITDGEGNQRVVHGPLKIEARQYIDFDKPTNLQDFVGNDYSFGYRVKGQDE